MPKFRSLIAIFLSVAIGVGGAAIWKAMRPAPTATQVNARQATDIARSRFGGEPAFSQEEQLKALKIHLSTLEKQRHVAEQQIVAFDARIADLEAALADEVVAATRKGAAGQGTRSKGLEAELRQLKEQRGQLLKEHERLSNRAYELSRLVQGEFVLTMARPAASKSAPEAVLASVPEPASAREPSFTPWPPPRPSAFDVVPIDLVLGRLSAPISMSAISDRLSKALDIAGYHQRSFFRVPNGFALVTQLEKIVADGAPVRMGRWATVAKHHAEISFDEYLKSLLFPEVGHYRLIVLVVTDQIVVPDDAIMSAPEAQAFVGRGANILPPTIGDKEFTANHNTTALIYQFRKIGKGNGEFVQPSGLSGRDHLEKAKVLAAFKSIRSTK